MQQYVSQGGNGVAVWVHRNGPVEPMRYEPWYQGFQVRGREVACLRLPKVTCWVLLYGLSVMGFHGEIAVTQVVIARELGVSRSSVSRAMRQLVACGVLVKGGGQRGGWQFQAKFAHKGSNAWLYERRARQARAVPVVERDGEFYEVR